MVPVRVENRAQLIYLLTEAAELEHEILCCYLFATFTMKDSTDEGLTPEQLDLVRRWRGVLTEIAVQEMTHLASACNLLTAIGGAPRLRRPNLPTGVRAYPPAFKLRLVPFGGEALDQFVMLERPELVAAQTAEQYRAAARPLDQLGDIFSGERQFETVGELYRGIEDGFTYLAQKLGEAQLFVGPTASQTAEMYFSLPGLRAVHNLASAREAIQVIVEQGEGASPDVEDSHYRRFLGLRDEYREALAADPEFRPARPVVESPHSIAATDVAEGPLVSVLDDPLSANVCNLFDGAYELMVQMLGRLFVHAEETPGQLKALADTAVGMMFDVLVPLGRALTALPAGPSYPGLNAGPSFRLSRSSLTPTHADAARVVFHERLNELRAYCEFLETQPGAPGSLAAVREAVAGFAAAFADR